jgi:RNA-directed DNA polymerase
MKRRYVNRASIARNLSHALLACEWTPRALRQGAEAVLGLATKDAQRRLIRSVTRKTAGQTPPSPAALVVMLVAARAFEEAILPLARHGSDGAFVATPPRFAPSKRFAGLDVPEITTLGDLADWFGVSVIHLDWLADDKRQHVRTAIPVLQHYRYTFIPKASGPPRLIEAPKSTMKLIQRRILRSILDPMPVHDCAHGFVAKRSVLTAARLHAGEAVLVTADLKDFFTTTRLSRVHGIFRALGYPWSVARALTSLCGTATPESVFTRLPAARRPDWHSRRMFRARHLAQGAPTSPTLANLAARGMDARLAGLANAYGCRYTRYADDLAFSGDEAFAGKVDSFLRAVDQITADEGYALNPKKTRIMRRGGCQRLTGLVVNDHVNVSRAYFDELKATLHNCVKTGPVAQNLSRLPDFRAHLDGRVTWVENVNPTRGRKLRAMFERVAW